MAMLIPASYQQDLPAQYTSEFGKNCAQVDEGRYCQGSGK